jgi:hypothetical protein
MEHHRITDKDEIPELCLKTFLTLDKALVVLWLSCGLIVTGIGGAVTWAFATNSSIVILKEKEATNETRINMLESQINQKLDILIKQKEQNND